MKRRRVVPLIVSVEGYTFHIFRQKKNIPRILAIGQGEKNEKELETIARLYDKCRKTFYKRKVLNSLSGTFQWCQNPSCPYAFYAKRYKRAEGNARFHSNECHTQITKKWTDELLRLEIRKLHERKRKITKR